MGLLDALKAFLSNIGKGKPKTQKAPGGKAAAAVATGKKTKPGPALKKKTAPPPDSLSLAFKGKPKGRKKSQKVTAGPIDEAALGFSISLKNDNAKERHSLRISVEGLTVHIHRLKKSFGVSDISATGLSFKFEKPRIKGGVKLEMDLLLHGKQEAAGIMCKVMHHEKGHVGCTFVELDRAQDDAVSKIVLLGQKQQADRKKAQKDKAFKVPA